MTASLRIDSFYIPLLKMILRRKRPVAKEMPVLLFISFIPCLHKVNKKNFRDIKCNNKFTTSNQFGSRSAGPDGNPLHNTYHGIITLHTLRQTR